MAAALTFDDLQEVVFLGRHPDHPDLEVLVLGGVDDEVNWRGALEMVGVALAARQVFPHGVVIVDLHNDYVRPAKMIRRRRR